MAFSVEHLGEDLLSKAGGMFRSLPDLLDALMRALAERLRPIGGSIHLRGSGTLIIGCHAGETISDWLTDPIDVPPHLASAAGDLPTSERTLRFPISYGGYELGELLLEMQTPLVPGDPAFELLHHFARHCGLLVKRYEVRQWSEQRLGRPLLLVGMSKPLRDLEQFLEISAHRHLPVLLRGEFGTEKALLAATIHCCSPFASGPFVQIECSNPSDTPGNWMKQAEGGTLFLSGVDELDEGLQKQLPQYLPSTLDQWLPPPPQAVRLIASTTKELHVLAHQNRFSRALLAELDFLSVTVPPLRERADDIDALICQILERNGFRPEDKRTDALVALCKAHSWPENLLELQRVIARLAVMTEGRPIQPSDVCRYAPTIVASTTADESHDGEDEIVERAGIDRWMLAALDSDGQAINGLHGALARALHHLGRNYAEPIALDTLAGHSNISPSHLSFLFRSEIGIPFKTLLCHIRIHQACSLLSRDDRRTVTDIALSVGFSDLSYFEKSFRRIVGQSPREFRRAQVAAITDPRSRATAALPRLRAGGAR